MLHVLFAVSLLQQDPKPAPAAPPTFAQVVAAHFAAWDHDADGTLSPAEIDALCVDAKIVGEQAAAAAALKRIVRSGKFAVPALTQAGLCAPTKPTAEAPAKEAPPAADPTAPPGAQDRRDSGEQPASMLPAPNFQASYVASLRRIRTSQRALFLDDTPDLDHCHQGPLGDCYFVAPVGAFVLRDSAAVKQVVKEHAAGGYEVRFGDGKAIVLQPLTDAEVALSGTTGDEGLWLAVLEKALGSLRHEANPTRYAMATATDAIARGGSSATIIRMLTGHPTTRIVLKKRPRGTVKGPDGKPMPKPPVPVGDVDTLAARVRTDVAAAFAHERLVTCGTGTEPQPPGINGKHAYAVLAFDADKDELTLWNPHGNTFRPKGEPGLVHGYPTRAGVFRVPVKDFVQVFGGVVMETDAPPKPAEAAKSADAPAATNG